MLHTSGIVGRAILLKHLDDLGIREAVLSVLELGGKKDPSIHRQIVEFQNLLVQSLYFQRKKPVSMRSNGSTGGLANQDTLLQEIFDTCESESWTALGFTNEAPKRAFNKTGHLGLLTLHATVLTDKINCMKWIETPSEPPFALTCLEAVTIFCDGYQINKHGCKSSLLTKDSSFSSVDCLIVSFQSTISVICQLVCASSIYS